MKTSVLKTSLASILASAVMALPAFAQDSNARALELAGAQKYDQALALLSAQDRAVQQGYDHRFLEARILSWAGRYPEARAEIDSLLIDYPGNADVMLALGNLEYYQGNLKAAERQYQAVLAIAPNYTDAQNGLTNVRKARAAARNRGGYRWRFDGGVGVSDFDVDGLSDWNEQFLRAERVSGDLAYSGSVTRYDRFDMTDVQFGLGVSDAVRGGFDWGLDFGLTPDSDFRPDLSLGGRAGYAISAYGGTVYHFGTSVRYDDYDTGDILTIQPELKAYLENGVVLTGRLISTFQSQEDDQLGWLVDGLVPINDRLRVKAGYARAPEAINGVAITTESLFGGVSYQVREDLDLHLNLARDDREDIYIRDSLNVGFTHKR